MVRGHQQEEGHQQGEEQLQEPQGPEVEGLQYQLEGEVSFDTTIGSGC